MTKICILLVLDGLATLLQTTGPVNGPAVCTQLYSPHPALGSRPRPWERSMREFLSYLCCWAMMLGFVTSTSASEE